MSQPACSALKASCAAWLSAACSMPFLMSQTSPPMIMIVISTPTHLPPLVLTRAPQVEAQAIKNQSIRVSVTRNKSDVTSIRSASPPVGRLSRSLRHKRRSLCYASLMLGRSSINRILINRSGAVLDELEPQRRVPPHEPLDDIARRLALFIRPRQRDLDQAAACGVHGGF